MPPDCDNRRRFSAGLIGPRACLLIAALALFAAGCQPQQQTGSRVVENLPDPLIGSTPLRPGRPPRDPPPAHIQPSPLPQARLDAPRGQPPAEPHNAWVPA